MEIFGWNATAMPVCYDQLIVWDSSREMVCPVLVVGILGPGSYVDRTRSFSQVKDQSSLTKSNLLMMAVGRGKETVLSIGC